MLPSAPGAPAAVGAPEAPSAVADPALIQQLMQLSTEQIDALPAEQREQVLALRQALANGALS